MTYDDFQKFGEEQTEKRKTDLFFDRTYCHEKSGLDE